MSFTSNKDINEIESNFENYSTDLNYESLDYSSCTVTVRFQGYAVASFTRDNCDQALMAAVMWVSMQDSNMSSDMGVGEEAAGYEDGDLGVGYEDGDLGDGGDDIDD
ncbi:hypothetical protein [Algibacter pacificus]|uniref:hypothetical protein n=1 Tax=Algibacter pacificus TaxID=2599389 RepID=UPI0011C77DD4|nr:hypothetical protein [Algibacter pacificus]